jgi:phosphoribosyl 1,2-cyclic phosphodiesterase/CheY-like chemotaxis protein
MKVQFYGTRGSLPVPGPRTVRYGGNTSCTAVRSASGTLVVLDMGTGAFALGQELAAAQKPIKGHVLISHTHWDHIQGLPFFAPFFRPGNEWDVYAPRGLGSSLRETLSGQMQYTYFPLELEQLGATIHYHDLVEGTLTLDDIAVETQYLNHPALTLGYKLKADGATLVHALDHEPFAPVLAGGSGPIEGADLRHSEFLAGADLVIHDAQYLAEEFGSKVGWGPSTVEYALHVARSAGVRKLALTHHDPERSDDAIDAIIAERKPKDGGPELFAAAEGTVIDLAPEKTGASLASRAHSSERLVETATTRPAMTGQTVLLAGGETALKQRLANILRSDQIAVTSVEPDMVLASVQKDNPSLLLIVDLQDRAAVTRMVRSIRKLPEPSRSLPIILAGESNHHAESEEPGVTDRLTEPFTDNYARTRLRSWLMRRACKWARPVIPDNETARVAALHALNILDTPPDRTIDAVVQLAAEIFSVPIAAVTLVDRERQWYKASRGLTARETPRDESFCAHVVANRMATVVPDTLLDPRFAENPEVLGPPYLRFYAGHPLLLAEGHCIGTLCIGDVRPRQLSQTGMRRLARMAALAFHAMTPANGRP